MRLKLRLNLKLRVTILISKLLIILCRLARLGGTTFPGKVAQLLYPGIIKELSSGLKIIMVTGTNGKTTTSRIIERILQENRLTYIANKSGANLVNGVITTFIEAVDFSGKTKAGIALIEIDEAAFSKICISLVPDVLVVTNFFRDQLDRYGELYGTLKLVKDTVASFNKTRLVLNADDSLCASIGNGLENEVIYYGVEKDALNFSNEVYKPADAVFCIYCKNKYEYNYHIYGHLGGFECPGCGYKRPEPEVFCTAITEFGDTYTAINLSLKDKVMNARINLPGLYNVYNALASAACCYALGLPALNTVNALASFESGFGRMETIPAEGKFLKLILVKNPTGFDQVLSFFIEQKDNIQIAFIINDNAADGRDISWLWDVDFEKLKKISQRISTFYTSGIRAEDMAMRLKYAGIDTNRISVIKDYNKLINVGLSETETGKSFYILPTYTAMLGLRKILKSKYKLRNFWE